MEVRDGRGPLIMRQCDVCPTRFKPKSPQHTHCSRRCAYIAGKLIRAAAKDMDRDVAIAFYGRQYEDPLRHVKRGRTKQLIRHVMNYCSLHHTILVTKGEIEEYSGLVLREKEMETAAKWVPALTFYVAGVDGGEENKTDVYQFLVSDLVTNADAIDRAGRRYHVR